jgi:CheY-like chemotaxis protein
MNILIVEDNLHMRELLVLYFSDNKYVITTAINGLEALELTKSSSFDLIISDINMPVMDGIKFALRLRENNLQTFIIFFSAEVNGHKIHGESIKKIGSALFIEKNISKLSLAVENFFQLRP